MGQDFLDIQYCICRSDNTSVSENQAVSIQSLQNNENRKITTKKTMLGRKRKQIIKTFNRLNQGRAEVIVRGGGG